MLQKFLSDVSRIADALEIMAGGVIAESSETAGEPEAQQPPEGLVDADGLPWDARIHSSNRKLAASGKWCRRKNVADGMYNRIMGEILAAQEAPAPPPAQEAPAPPPAIVPPGSPGSGLTFPEVIKRITTAGYTARQPDTITPFLTPLGIPTLPVLASKPELWPQVLKAMGLPHE